MTDNILSVKQLNFYVKSLIEGDNNLSFISVTGEISNFKSHYSSGHLYFTLKDNDASIRCVMFKANANRVNFDIKDGMQVVLSGRVSLYEKEGQYQFYAEQMFDIGLGNITLEFNKLKTRLQAEGLFDNETKRPIPKFPKNIAVVTSKTGAAVKDIINVITRRWPLSKIVLCSVSVQGELAVPEMLNCLDRIYKLSFADVIIIGRGGGSIEDLWAFNNEELARKIYESPVPVISAVGHETDFTICDFVADLRAPTPSAAAELAVPDIVTVFTKIEKLENQLKKMLLTKLDLSKSRFKSLTQGYYFKSPVDALIASRYITLDRLNDNLKNHTNKILTTQKGDFSALISRLDALSPLKVLNRGYASVTKNNVTVNSVASLKIGENLSLKFADGDANCTVNSINLEDKNG